MLQSMYCAGCVRVINGARTHAFTFFSSAVSGAAAAVGRAARKTGCAPELLLIFFLERLIFPLLKGSWDGPLTWPALEAGGGACSQRLVAAQGRQAPLLRAAERRRAQCFSVRRGRHQGPTRGGSGCAWLSGVARVACRVRARRRSCGAACPRAVRVGAGLARARPDTVSHPLHLGCSFVFSAGIDIGWGVRWRVLQGSGAVCGVRAARVS